MPTITFVEAKWHSDFVKCAVIFCAVTSILGSDVGTDMHIAGSVQAVLSNKTIGEDEVGNNTKSNGVSGRKSGESASSYAQLAQMGSEPGKQGSGSNMSHGINNLGLKEQNSSDSVQNITTRVNQTDCGQNCNKGSSPLPEVIVSPSLITGQELLPEKGAAEEEHHSSLSIFFVLSVLAMCTLLIHFMIQTHFQYLPESVAVMFLGALIGLIMKLMSGQNMFGNWQKEETFSPTVFFLILLPPIIFESGYNLHKGNFFQNIGSILLFAVFGTIISALFIGSSIYLLGVAQVAYKLSFVESFAFGSLISAVDPVATLAIFHALDVDPILNMLVFGESILNDAVAIVLTTTVINSAKPAMADMSSAEAVMEGIKDFVVMFFASAGIGTVFALMSALLLKHVDLRKNPSLEFAMMLAFTYIPYALAEGIHLSGIMAILFCGIVMSHYTHLNLSPVTQITMQQTMRTLSFISETCVFAYLGLAVFSFHHRIEPALVIWSIILCLLGRAVNIFPLTIVANKFRTHRITKKMTFIMWFSGLRGAIAYALALHLEFEDETRHVLVTTTLVIVVFTILVFGGSAMPLIKFLSRYDRKRRVARRRRSAAAASENVMISLSKTREMGHAIDSEHLSEMTENDDYESLSDQAPLSGFVKFDLKYCVPFFTRHFTQQELRDCKSQIMDLTNKWYEEIRVSPSGTESDEEIWANSNHALTEQNND